MPRLLTLDASGAQVSAAVVIDGDVVAQRTTPSAHGQSAVLAPMVAEVLAEGRLGAGQLDAIAVTIGPGSFTGLRAALALAHGIALAAGIPLIGVTLAEALAEAVPDLGDRVLWTVLDSRRGRVFLHDGREFRAVALGDLVSPEGVRLALAGDAAEAAADALARCGGDVILTGARLPRPGDIARAAARRLSSDLPPRAAQPLYIDPPEARPPAGGLRPAPMG